MRKSIWFLPHPSASYILQWAERFNWVISHLQVTRVNGRRFQALGWTVKAQEERHGGGTTICSRISPGVIDTMLWVLYRHSRFKLENDQISKEIQGGRFSVNHQQHSNLQRESIKQYSGDIPQDVKTTHWQCQAWQYHVRNFWIVIDSSYPLDSKNCSSLDIDHSPVARCALNDSLWCMKCGRTVCWSLKLTNLNKFKTLNSVWNCFWLFLHVSSDGGCLRTTCRGYMFFTSQQGASELLLLQVSLKKPGS